MNIKEIKQLKIEDYADYRYTSAGFAGTCLLEMISEMIDGNSDSFIPLKNEEKFRRKLEEGYDYSKLKTDEIAKISQLFTYVASKFINDNIIDFTGIEERITKMLRGDSNE